MTEEQMQALIERVVNTLEEFTGIEETEEAGQSNMVAIAVCLTWAARWVAEAEMLSPGAMRSMQKVSTDPAFVAACAAAHNKWLEAARKKAKSVASA